VLDPQGKAIEGVASARQGKVFDVELDTANKAQAGTALRAACEPLLVNTVVENYWVGEKGSRELRRPFLG
jgi:phosphoribosylformylglycinamidine synthase